MNILITGANGQLGNEMRVLSKETDNMLIFSLTCRNWTFATNKLCTGL